MPVEGAVISQVQRPFPEVWPPLGLLLYRDTHRDVGGRRKEQCKRSQNTQITATQHSSISPATQKWLLCRFSKQWTERNRHREETALLKTKKQNENISKSMLCCAPASSLETVHACGPFILVWRSFHYTLLHWTIFQLALYPVVSPRSPPLQSICLKTHPQLNKQHEGACRGTSWTCLLKSAPAEVPVRIFCGCHRS